ncbi:Flagellar hook-associated protein 2 [Rubripirellula obstinata]|uniref:Filament cap protein n=1 Tax=Rubripirellula obstinata TaxID=406547 RepID=A0A5B1CJ95_9BACT|nr:flagellar filament capping protein FliD [Rubripirellula obstinata]KAA1259364.1 Flagellar hook-associated protein 2 [Rubripirellula obstinata]
MGRIQSSIGLITGTDIAGTVDQLMAINAQPRDRLLSRTQTLQAEQRSIDELTASVIGVQFSGAQLSNLSTFRSKSAASSDSDALSVLAGSKATAATHDVRTIQTAATHTVRSRAQFDSDSEALGLTGTIKITPDGFLDQSASLSSLNNGRGVDAGKIRITDRSGSSADIDLSSAQTIDDVITAINDADIDVAATTVGGKLQLTDQTGSTSSNLVVEQLGNDETAADLGLWGIDVAADTATGFNLTFNVDADTDLSQLRQGKGVRLDDGNDLSIKLSDGSSLDVDFGDFGGAEQPTIQDVVDALNAVDPAKISASFTSKGIEVVDLTTGTEAFSISDATDSKAASDLGLVGSTSSGDTITAEFEAEVLRGTSIEKLSGGSGLTGLTTLDVTTADGSSAAIDLSSATNTAEIIDAINQSGLDIIARLNDSGTGLRLRDVSGGTGNFVISSADDTADSLGVAANTENDIVVGTNLNKQTVNRDTLLSSLRGGIGVDDGSFTITDSDGGVAAINIAADGITSVGGLIDKINGLGIDVTASLSESGDGITLVDNAGGTDTLKVSDSGNGTTASDLGIAGEATDQTINGATVSALAGTQADVIQIEATDSLASIVEKLNASENYATAAVELNNDGSYGLRVRSNKGGAAGRFGLLVNGFDLQIDTTAQAQDAKIAVSTDGGSERLLSSSDGVFDLNDSEASTATVTSSTKLSDFASGAASGSFLVTDSAGTVSAINVTVQGIETVGELVQAFNDLGIGIEASVNEDGTGISIVDTAGGSEKLTITDVGNGIAASSLGIAGEADDETIAGETVQALNGTGQSNEEDDATGLTFTLKELSSETISVTVTEDSSKITAAAKTFVDQYNNLVDKLESLTFFNADSNEVGLLFGSSEAQRIRSGYSRLLSGAISGAGNIKTIGQVGMRFNDEGKLDLDSSRLASAVEDSREDVESFFTTQDNGLADRLDSLAESIAGVDSGLLLNRRQTLTTQVERNNDRIETLNSRLEDQRERLLISFFQTEEAISKIQSNSSAIEQIQRISL